MESWLVQIPPGVDISKAKEIKDGEFQIGKSTFILTPAPVSIGDCIILREEDGKYSQAAGPKQLMELTKSISLPKIDKSVKQPKPLVPQRQNLKTRHFATGYESDTAPATEAIQKRQIDEDFVEPTPKKQKISSEAKTPKSDKKKKSKSEKTPKSDKKDKKSKSSKDEKKKKAKSE